MLLLFFQRNVVSAVKEFMEHMVVDLDAFIEANQKQTNTVPISEKDVSFLGFVCKIVFLTGMCFEPVLTSVSDYCYDSFLQEHLFNGLLDRAGEKKYDSPLLTAFRALSAEGEEVYMSDVASELLGANHQLVESEGFTVTDVTSLPADILHSITVSGRKRQNGTIDPSWTLVPFYGSLEAIALRRID
ncbi:hypothetical protein AGDE_16862 [Angomonas deanei]|nr:hypothetical protein AGDE_16862 [Angomonas deanei]|eukprot:EPY16029.1 hypothetical protein AGDE_16862 [Angomonas deanei]